MELAIPQIFNAISAHFLNQKMPCSAGGLLRLQYNGLSSAIGVFIPSSKYVSEMEEFSIVTEKDVRKFRENFVGCLPETVFRRSTDFFLADMERIHDSPITWRSEAWIKCMIRRAALRHNIAL